MYKDDQIGEIPVACTLGDAEFARREEEIAREVFPLVESVEELPDGYAFEFPAEMEITPRIIEFISFERHCCPFFTFELIFTPARGSIWLRLRGPEGVKGVIEELLPSRMNGDRKKERAR